MTNHKMIRYSILGCFLLGMAAWVWPAAPPGKLPDTSQMNILMINVEDLTTRAVGCYGNSAVKTPHIDQLAREGVLFSRAYAQGSMCNPSRSSFNTGLRPLTTGILGNNDALDEHLPPSSTSTAEILQNKDAYLAHLGKLYHFVPPANEQMSAFDEVGFCVEPEGFTGVYRYEEDTSCAERRFQYSTDPEIEQTLIERHRKMKKVEERIPHGGDGWWEQGGKQFYLVYFELLGDSGEPEECMEDGQKARAAAKIIEEKAAQGQQFFLSVGFDKPHTPTIAPKEYVDKYPPEAMELSAAVPEQDRNIPAVAKRFGNKPDIFKPGEAEDFPQFAQTPAREKKAVSAYYAAASYIDAQVGLLMDQLEASGVADNTIVIFFSDHGFHLGEHGMWSKYSLFEEVVKVPLIVKVPGQPVQGVQSDQLVELVDLLPSLCDLWDIPPHKSFEGTSWVPLLEQPDQPWKQAAFSTSHLQGYTAHATVTPDYKYNRWTKNDTLVQELYHLAKDPHEQVNLAENPEYQEVLEKMQTVEQRGWKGALPR